MGKFLPQVKVKRHKAISEMEIWGKALSIVRENSYKARKSLAMSKSEADS
jgi:hypothetical protein